MDVKFVTGSINLGSKKTMADIASDVLGRGTKKEASAEKVVKTAKKAEEDKVEKKAEEDKDEEDMAEKDMVEEEDEAAGDEEEKEAKVKAKKEVKAETKKIQFVKIAKLTPESRNFLKEFWLNIYSPEYVEAMLAEK